MILLLPFVLLALPQTGTDTAVADAREAYTTWTRFRGPNGSGVLDGRHWGPQAQKAGGSTGGPVQTTTKRSQSVQFWFVMPRLLDVDATGLKEIRTPRRMRRLSQYAPQPVRLALPLKRYRTRSGMIIPRWIHTGGNTTFHPDQESLWRCVIRRKFGIFSSAYAKHSLKICSKHPTP